MQTRKRASQLTNETGSSLWALRKISSADFVRVFLQNQRTAKPGNAKGRMSLVQFQQQP
jgi:hypothetical protein